LEESIFLKDNYEFVVFGYQHISVLLFFAIIGFILIKYGLKSSQEIQVNNPRGKPTGHYY